MILSLGFCLTLLDNVEDQVKFQYIYDNYRYRMFYICKDILKEQQLAEDALQEAFLRIIKKIDMIRDVSSNSAACYVYLIAKCKAIDLYRKETKDRDKEFPMLEYDLLANNGIEGELIKHEESREIIAAIQNLKPFSRNILELYLQKGLSRREISVLLNIRYDTVRKRVKTAIKELQVELEKKGIHE